MEVKEKIDQRSECRISGIMTGDMHRKKARMLMGSIRALKKIRRRPTLPLSFPSSTIGAEELNFRVRDGNGCLPFAIATENLRTS